MNDSVVWLPTVLKGVTLLGVLFGLVLVFCRVFFKWSPKQTLKEIASNLLPPW